MPNFIQKTAIFAHQHSISQSSNLRIRILVHIIEHVYFICQEVYHDNDAKTKRENSLA